MTISSNLWGFLGEIKDPRRGAGRRFSLQSILALIIAGLLCGNQSLYAISCWARRLSKEQLQLIGINRQQSPSQATIHNLLVKLDPTEVEKALGRWVQSLSGNENLHISIDGKAIKSSATEEYPALHLLSAFCASIPGVLHQLPVETKKNEISAAKELLEEIPVKQNIITGDAIFCQKELCDKIVRHDGDFIFIVKNNQKILFSGIKKIFSPE